MRRTVVLVVSIVAVVLAASPIPASATSVGRTDGNDVAFPLDIASVKVTHASGAHVFELRAHNGFTNTQIAPANGWFRLGFDLDGDSGWERNLFIQYIDGRIRGLS